MASNDRIILDEVLKQRQAEVDPTAALSDFFELFVAEQVLKDSDLSYDEIESGRVGDGGDGGIDSFHLFVNGELVQEEPDLDHFKKNITIDVVLTQAKTAAGFQESPVERFITVSDEILDLSKPTAELAKFLNEPLVDAISRFRHVQQRLASRFPKLRVTYFYASKGAKPEAATTRKVEKLEAVVKGHFPEADFAFHFLGAGDLLQLARRAPKTTFTLTLAENLVSPEGGFVCLVLLRDFYEFISDDGKQLRRQIFEANVRDYQGPTEVNDEIQKSLQDQVNTEDFWWLNNGITILASRASQTGKTLTIEDPQIVNGLQTSTEIHKYCHKFNADKDARRVLVRVIVPKETGSRDRIIKATNSQTSVAQASLRATDKIHRDIEEYLRPRGSFYDRRKNFYKNDGKPRERVIGIPHLAQAVMSILLQRPDTARARPASLLKIDDDYRRVYNLAHPINLYWVCGESIRRVEAYLRTRPEVSARDKNNLRFYVAMHAVVKMTGKPGPSASDLSKLDPSNLDPQRIADALSVVTGHYNSLGGSDQVAKGTALLAAVRAKL